MNWIKWIQFAMQIIPLILDLIAKIEALLPQGTGPAKLQLLQDLVAATLTPDVPTAQVQKLVSVVASTAVSSFNTTGVFKHSA